MRYTPIPKQENILTGHIPCNGEKTITTSLVGTETSTDDILYSIETLGGEGKTSSDDNFDSRNATALHRHTVGTSMNDGNLEYVVDKMVGKNMLLLRRYTE